MRKRGIDHRYIRIFLPFMDFELFRQIHIKIEDMITVLTGSMPCRGKRSVANEIEKSFLPRRGNTELALILQLMQKLIFKCFVT